MGKKQSKTKEPITLWTRSNQIWRRREQLNWENTGVLCYCTQRGAHVNRVAAVKTVDFGIGGEKDNIATDTHLNHQQL